MVYFTQAYGQDTGYRTDFKLNRYIGKSIAINQIEKKGNKISYQWHHYSYEDFSMFNKHAGDVSIV